MDIQNEIKKEDYKITVYNQDFGFKNKVTLFFDGFKNSSQGILSLFTSYVFWLLLIVAVGGGFEYLSNNVYYTTNNKEFLQTSDFIDYLFAFQIFFFVAFVYNTQQTICINNLFKFEKINDQNGFMLFIKQLPLLILLSAIFGLLMFGIAYGLGWYLNYFFGGVKFEMYDIKGIAFVLLSLALISIMYFFMLSLILTISTTNIKTAFKINVLKKLYRSFFKIIKMFSLILPMLMMHLFVLLIFAIIVGYITTFAFEYYIELYKDVYAVNQIAVYCGIFIFFPLFTLVQTFLNKARIKSIIIMFMITEDMDEYDERLTLPLK